MMTSSFHQPPSYLVSLNDDIDGDTRLKEKNDMRAAGWVERRVHENKVFVLAWQI